jgi:CheY-like chemotaxis protein
MTNETKSLQILVVENHPDTVKWLQLFLEDLGHKVGTAKNLSEAQAALAERTWQVLISDIGLPDGAGWDLLEKGGHRRPPFAIAMSGFGMNADSARSRAAGFRHHLLKPFRTKDLEELLDKASIELNGTE